MTTAPKVQQSTITGLFARISHDFVVIGTSTFCHAFLDGKFFLATGHSACVSPENFNAETGRQLAYTDMRALAEKKLWELERYRLYREMHP